MAQAERRGVVLRIPLPAFGPPERQRSVDARTCLCGKASYFVCDCGTAWCMTCAASLREKPHWCKKCVEIAARECLL